MRANGKRKKKTQNTIKRKSFTCQCISFWLEQNETRLNVFLHLPELLF